MEFATSIRQAKMLHGAHDETVTIRLGRLKFDDAAVADGARQAPIDIVATMIEGHGWLVAMDPDWSESAIAGDCPIQGEPTETVAEVFRRFAAEVASYAAVIHVDRGLGLQQAVGLA